jgi:GlpG protein
MREIGTVPDARNAQRLADYLLTLGIRSRVDASPDGATIWVYDEDRRDDARRELDEFNAHPTDPRYEAATQQARRLEQEAIKNEKRYRKNVIDLRDRWGSATGRRPVTFTLIGISLAAALISGFGDNAATNPWTQELFITPPVLMDGQGVGLPTSLRPTLEGQWWRLITPIFLHFGLPHLLFNTLAILSLGTPVEMRRGSWRMLAMVLAMAIASNVAQFYWDGPNFGGLSGVAFGLFGYIWMQSHFEPAAGFYMPPSTLVMVMVWFALCFTGAVGPVANAAHTVGLAVGAVIGVAPVTVKKLFH